jgi:hypothetical protein
MTRILSVAVMTLAPRLFAQDPSSVALRTEGIPAARIELDLKATGKPQDVPPQVPFAVNSYQMTVSNQESRGVLAYALEYRFEDSTGTSKGRTCASSYVFDKSQPRISPGASHSLTPQFSIPPGTVTLKAILDLVLFDDGSYLGANACGTLGRIQHELTARRNTQAAILRMLEAEGLERTKQSLRSEISKRETDDKVILNPKKSR